VTEAYVNRREMARILGVAVSTLDKLVAQGDVPSVTWGLRTRRFLPSEVIRALHGPVSRRLWSRSTMSA
jgi:excisionase family DNA binding protein